MIVPRLTQVCCTAIVAFFAAVLNLQGSNRSITQAELTDELIHGETHFTDLIVADRWFGKGLDRSSSTPIRFEHCDFVNGIEFQNLQISVPLYFYNCTFGADTASAIGPNDNLIQECYLFSVIQFSKCQFYWHTRFCNSVFPSLFTSAESTWSKTLTIDSCSFAYRLRFDRGTFADRVRIENSDFGASLDITDSKFAHLVSFERTHISSDLILESGSVTGTPDYILRFVDTIVVGELNLDHFTFREKPNVKSSKMIIQESTIGDIRGVGWDDFRAAFVSADHRNRFEVLAQLRRSYLQLGQTTDAGNVFLDMKATEAEAKGPGYKVFDTVMRATSGWGTRPELLVGWFFGMVSAFLGIYLVVGICHLGVGRRLVRVLLPCLVLSLTATLLQSDSEDIQRIAALSETSRFQQHLRNAVTLHKFLASLFLLILAAYFGSALSSF